MTRSKMPPQQPLVQSLNCNHLSFLCDSNHILPLSNLKSIHIHFSVRSSLVLLDETSMSQLPILSILVIGLLHTKAL